MAEGHEVHAHVQVEADLAVVGEVGEIVVDELQGGIEGDIETHGGYFFCGFFALVRFDEVEGDGIVFPGMAKFKKKLAKFLEEADLDLVAFFLRSPGGMVAAKVVAHLFLIFRWWFPFHAFMGGIEDFIANGLPGGGFEFLQVGGVVTIIEECVAVFGKGGHMLSRLFAFVCVVGAEQEGGDEPGGGAPGKGLAYEPAFAFGELVAEEARCQQRKGIVHGRVMYKKAVSVETAEQVF